jgi:hypothetical protein
MFNNIYDNGTTSPYDDNYCNCCTNPLFAQICETDKLYFSNDNSNFQKIIKTSATVSISSFDIIRNPIGEKIIINGKKHIKIAYTQNDNCSKLLFAKYTVPFCMYIPIESKITKIKNIETSVENVCFHKVSDNMVAVSMIISAWPIFIDHSKSIEYTPYLQHCDCNSNNSLPPKITSTIFCIIKKIVSFIIAICLLIKLAEIIKLTKSPDICHEKHHHHHHHHHHHKHH